MWGRTRKPAEPSEDAQQPGPLKEAVRHARVELAEQTSVVVELRDAELARLELLNEALDPLFAEVPAELDMFDRGISQGDTPRLWIDMVAHAHMGRDKRQYRFVQDTRFGRRVLAESNDVHELVGAITRYVATRLIERERAMATRGVLLTDRRQDLGSIWRRHRWQLLLAFLFGLVVGVGALFAALWVIASKS